MTIDKGWTHRATPDRKRASSRSLPIRLLPFALLITALARAATGAAPEAYRQKWQDEAIGQRIERNIDRYRKGNATIELVDTAGKPVVGARVELQQTGHEFLFGCNAFVLGQLEPPEQERRYEEAFARLFNFATVPLYWEGTEPVPGELRYSDPSREIWRRPPAERFLPWAARHGITLKGHPLLWHAYNPPWLPKEADPLRELYRKRFREIAGRFGGKIPIFDVVNESQVCPQSYPLLTPDRDYVRWAFAEVAPLFPENTTLMINEVTEYNFQPYAANPYVAQIKTLLSQGAEVRGIGLQYHFFRRERLDAYLASPKCDPGKLLDLYERLAEFTLPLYITEITFPSAGEDGAELQAEVVRDHYRLWFSAPSMAGITWWNLGDGTAVKGENEAEGGLVDGDLKPKPAYRALEKLINEEWNTQVQVQTDAQGQAVVRGFYGRYRVSVSHGGKTQTYEIHHSRTRDTPHTLVAAN